MLWKLLKNLCMTFRQIIQQEQWIIFFVWAEKYVNTAQYHH